MSTISFTRTRKLKKEICTNCRTHLRKTYSMKSMSLMTLRKKASLKKSKEKQRVLMKNGKTKTTVTTISR